MPELSRFFGIVTRMFMAAGEPHHVPRLHAYNQEFAAVFGVDPEEILADELPRRQQRFVEAWAELHQDE
jgi:hypothetical protein